MHAELNRQLDRMLAEEDQEWDDLIGPSAVEAVRGAGREGIEYLRSILCGKASKSKVVQCHAGWVLTRLHGISDTLAIRRTIADALANMRLESEAIETIVDELNGRIDLYCDIAIVGAVCTQLARLSSSRQGEGGAIRSIQRFLASAKSKFEQIHALIQRAEQDHVTRK